jgi:hypothetical protein
VAIGPEVTTRDHRAMQVITPPITRRVSFGSIVLGTLVGAVLLVGGLSVGWLAFGTPFINQFTPVGRPGPTQVVAGMLAWSFALIAPATFTIAGLARIVTVVDSVASSRPKPTPVSRLARRLGEEYVVASRLRLPDGRVIPDLVLGPFGAAVIEPAPPSGAIRRHGDAWEVRTDKGWMPLENPLDRATRDAERVRSWFTNDDRDFVVKVYAAVIAADQPLQRTPSCAVIAPKQIEAWIQSLPAQRSLTPSRRESLTELLRNPS